MTTRTAKRSTSRERALRHGMVSRALGSVTLSVRAAAVVAALASATLASPQAPEGERGRKLEDMRRALQRANAASERAADITRWLDDLDHPEIARREMATRRLIETGPTAARRVRVLCDADDPSLAIRARRVFGAIHGLPPETFERLNKILEQHRTRRLAAGDTAAAIEQLPPVAVRAAIRLLEPEKGAPSDLYVELDVRRSIAAIAGGIDLEARAQASILAHGTRAAQPLLRIANDGKASLPARAHSVWLFANVAGSDRLRGLARLFSAPEPTLRREATLAALDGFEEADLRVMARAFGDEASVERDLVAAAASRHLTVEALGKLLGDKDAATASLAALALGRTRSEEAVEALTNRLELRKSEAGTREAIAAALGEHPSEEAAVALAELYARDDDPGVRAAAIAALRPREEIREARIALGAALFDADESVRFLAASALASNGKKVGVPALVQASGVESSDTVRARIFSGLATLAPDGPTATIPGKDPAVAWTRWLERNSDEFTGEELPWFKDSRDAKRIVTSVRSYVAREFFYFDEASLVKPENLNRAALKALGRLFEEDDEESERKDGLEVDGFERRVLERFVASARSGSSGISDPGALMAALGGLPFATEPSDLIRMTNAAAGGMVRSLGDRYSRLTLSNDAEGNVRPGWLPGLLDDNDKTNGFIASPKDETWVVDFVLYDSPSFYAGFQPGDQLVKVGDEFVGGMTAAAVREALNTENEFSILREGWNRPYAFNLVPVKADTDRLVTRAVLPGKIGYVRLTAFDAACSVKIEQALLEMEQDGIVGLVLDLRNNPGGTVVDATEIVDKFLPAGKLISINTTRVNDDETSDEEVRSTDSESDREYPLAVLINESSASASEMTSGSLQGNERAIVVGSTSFGKGIGQSGRQFPGFSSETALGTTRSVYAVSLTMMRYYLPEGKRSIHNIGVEPDIPVRERNLKGSLFDKVMRVAQGPHLKKYVDTLLDDHRDKAIELARFDGEDTSRYPDFADFYKKVKRNVSEAEARRIVRAEIRRRYLNDREFDRFDELFYDLQEDRTLRAGIRAVAEDAGVAFDEIDEYR